MAKKLQRGLGFEAEECGSTVPQYTQVFVLQRGLGFEAEECGGECIQWNIGN